MTSATYFPEQRHLLPLSLIRRERRLDEDVEGRVEVVVGQRVSVRDVIARGTAPAPYHVLEAARYFRLRQPDAVADLLTVEPGTWVDAGQVIARKGRRRLTAPVVSRLVEVTGGRILLQQQADSIELEAGLNGVVIEVKPGRGAVIETLGAVLQGVWGSNRRAIGTLRMEPADGLETIYSSTLDMQYRGAIVVTRRPLRASGLKVMADQGFSGIIAPSLDPTLYDAALAAPGAILLTEGFGSQRMSTAAYQFLDELDGRGALLDACPTLPFEARWPEVVITVPLTGSERPPAALVNLSLQTGLSVRITRGPSAGSLGQVVGLPKTPVLMDNGLRVLCAQVELVTGEKLTVPLANLESIGR